MSLTNALREMGLLGTQSTSTGRRAARGLRLEKPARLGAKSAEGNGDGQEVIANKSSSTSEAALLQSRLSIGDGPATLVCSAVNDPQPVQDAEPQTPGRRAARGLKLEKPARLGSKSAETEDVQTAIIRDTKKSLTSQMSHDSGLGDMSMSYSRSDSHMEGLTASGNFDDLDWNDIDSSPDNVFTFGKSQMSCTSYHVNHAQPFNNLYTGSNVYQPKKTPTKGRGRAGSNRRFSTENSTNSHRPGGLNATGSNRRFSNGTSNGPTGGLNAGGLRLNNRGFMRSQSMPVGCQALDSVTEQWDSDTDTKNVHGASVISTSCDIRKDNIPYSISSSMGIASSTKLATDQNGNTINGGTGAYDTVLVYQNSATDPDATPKAMTRLASFTQQMQSQGAGDQNSKYQNKPASFTQQMQSQGAGDQNSKYQNKPTNTNNSNIYLNKAGKASADDGKMGVQRDYGEYRDRLEMTDSSTDVTEEGTSASDTSATGEQHYAWDLLEELSDCMGQVSLKEEDTKARYKQSWRTASQNLAHSSDTGSVDNAAQKVDSQSQVYYPADIEAIEAELDFMKDGDECRNSLEYSTGLTMSSSTAGALTQSGPAHQPQSKFENSAYKFQEPANVKDRRISVGTIRQPLSHTSSQEEISKVEEGLSSNMYTPKGRRSMFRIYRLCQADDKELECPEVFKPIEQHTGGFNGRLPEPIHHVIQYTADALLEFGTSQLSREKPDGWSLMCKLFPDVCRSQVSKYFDCLQYMEERNYVMEQYYVKEISPRERAGNTNNNNKDSSRSSSTSQYMGAYHRSMSETAAPAYNPTTTRAGFGIPRSKSTSSELDSESVFHQTSSGHSNPKERFPVQIPSERLPNERLPSAAPAPIVRNGFGAPRSRSMSSSSSTTQEPHASITTSNGCQQMPNQQPVTSSCTLTNASAGTGSVVGCRPVPNQSDINSLVSNSSSAGTSVLGCRPVPNQSDINSVVSNSSSAGTSVNGCQQMPNQPAINSAVSTSQQISSSVSATASVSTGNDSQFVKPPSGFVPPRKSSASSTRSRNSSSQSDSSQVDATEGNMDGKSETRVRRASASPAGKLFASATKNLLVDRTQPPPLLKRSISDPGNEASVVNNSLYKELLYNSGASGESRHRHSSRTSSRSRTSSISSNRSDTEERSRRHSSSSRSHRGRHNSNQAADEGSPPGPLNKDFLPAKCPW